ncbi:MAG: SpoIIE family protein phosphatase [Armatimonadetes bacterium]|nr:SpoIIE family protein phosphatase [Armatimonadota bacterium]
MRAERAALAKSMAPALAITLSTLLVAAVVTALGWQDIIDEYDHVVADQLAMLSRAKGDALARCHAGAVLVLDLESCGMPLSQGIRLARLPFGAAVYRQVGADRFELATNTSAERPPDGLLSPLPPAKVAVRGPADAPWLIVVVEHTIRTPYIVAQPLRRVVEPSSTDTGLGATTTLDTGPSDSAETAPRHTAARLVGQSSVELGRVQGRVTVSTERAKAVRPALHRFTRFCLAMALPLLACICLLGVIAGRAVVASLAEHRRAAERQALHQISEALLSAPTLREVLQCIVDRARGMFGAAGACLALVDPSTGDLVFEVASAAAEAAAQRLAGRRMATAAGLTGWTVANQEAVLRNGDSSTGAPVPSLDEALGGDRDSAMAAPLLDDQKRCFGAVCLVSASGHPFGEADLLLLRSLATTAAVATARAAAVEREREQARVANELDVARTVQQSLLPAQPLVCHGFDLDGASEPAHEVGGDFYDFNALDDGRVSFIIADVADKGLGAAMFMVVCRSLYYACGAGRRPTAETLADLNSRLVAVNNSNLFVTVFHGLLDPLTGRLDYACAGHLPPILWRAGAASATFVSERGMALGVVDAAPIGTGTLTIEPGDALVLYTDGITDALDADERAFGTDRLLAAVASGPHGGASALTAALMASVKRHVGATAPFDDTTLVVVCRSAAGDPAS